MKNSPPFLGSIRRMNNLNCTRFDLQVIPAWLKWKAQKGTVPLLSFYRKIDLFVIITFILIAFLVGLQLKRNAI